MKKGIFITVLALCLVLCGCGRENIDDGGGGYCFISNGVTLSVGEDADRIIRDLGEPNNCSKAESCADEGIDEIYVYNGFSIFVHRKNGKGIITAININNDAVQTPEGARIGDSREKITGIYGKGNESNGISKYVGEASTLIFYFRNDRVSAIKYVETDR